MTVTNPYVNSGNPQTRALPTNGVIYVANRTGGCGSQPPPSERDLRRAEHLRQPLRQRHLHLQHDAGGRQRHHHPPAVGPRHNGDLIGSGNSVLGLVANNFVRVYHPRAATATTCRRSWRTSASTPRSCRSCTPSRSTTTTAATKLETLTVNGAIAQKYRGAVGTSGGTGFNKDYNYDDRLRYRSPPYFLEPIAASWHVIRSNEQVPPR